MKLNGIFRLKFSLFCISFFLFVGGSRVEAQLPPGCTQSPPFFNVEPLSRQANPGITLAYFVELVNNDSAECPARNFVMSDVIPSGFSSFFDQIDVLLYPTEAFYQNYYLTSSNSSSLGIYSAKVVVTDEADPSLFISRSIYYKVVEPAPVCSVAPPLIVIAPESNSGQAGESLNYGISITNQDSPSCAAYNFNLSGAFASEFSGSLGQTSVFLNPSENVNVSLSVTSLIGTAPGIYPFDISTQDLDQPVHALPSVPI